MQNYKFTYGIYIKTYKRLDLICSVIDSFLAKTPYFSSQSPLTVVPDDLESWEMLCSKYSLVSAVKILPFENRLGSCGTWERAFLDSRGHKNDYTLIFEDDCYPYKEGWLEAIDDFLSHKAARVFSLVHFLPAKPYLGIYSEAKNIYWNRNVQVLESVKIGNYEVNSLSVDTASFTLIKTNCLDDEPHIINPSFEKYGFWHSELQLRLQRKGLNPWRSCVLKNLENYFYSRDFLLPKDKVENSGMSKAEKEYYAARNRIKFLNLLPGTAGEAGHLIQIPKDFSWQMYLNNYPDLQRAKLDTKEKLERHWLKYGFKENRIYTRSIQEPLHCEPIKQPKLKPEKLPGSLWGICVFFNPAGFSNKIVNYRRFRKNSRLQGLKLITVQVAFGDNAYEIIEGEAEILVSLRSHSVLWIKENLLNIALDYLPADCDKVVWLDADIIFENENWISELNAALEKYVVVQPFSQGIRLTQAETNDHKIYSYAFGYLHGVEVSQTGYAWAARRQILDRNRFFDFAIVGGGDRLIANAFSGEYIKLETVPPKIFEKYLLWGRQVEKEVDSSIFYLNGNLLHLWHGELTNRSYHKRNLILEKYNFDPAKDLKKSKEGLLELAIKNEALQSDIKRYFYSRKEEVLNVN